MKNIASTFELVNGYKIPCVGFGTWQTDNDTTSTSAVIEAIRTGYRHIDSAANYKNEVGVGKGIRESGVDRRELFITSKVWNTERGYDKTMAAFERTMTNLGLDYLDLYLIHFPAVKKQFDNWDEINLSTWKAMTELYKSGRIKAIGVSNFMPHHLKSLMLTEVQPMVNQIEFHPGQIQTEAMDYCRKNGIVVEAWSPLGTGLMLSNPTLMDIAAKYNKSVAQLCIRWCLQNGTVPLPKSVNPARIKENADIFDFVISDSDMATINAMPYFGGSGQDPDEIDF